VAYFDQFRNQLDDEKTLIETIAPGSDYVEIGGQRKHIIGYLEEFLFPADRARAKVSSLSGGERNRLLLARLFARPANILVLDEPTNDLDIDTLELLEQLLQDYAGTVILVSHDRAFLDNVATQSIAFAGDGVLLELPGGYSDWLGWRDRVAAEARPQRNRRKQAGKPATNPPHRLRQSAQIRLVVQGAEGTGSLAAADRRAGKRASRGCPPTDRPGGLCRPYSSRQTESRSAEIEETGCWELLNAKNARLKENWKAGRRPEAASQAAFQRRRPAYLPNRISSTNLTPT
jgi:energy-coupling factor transporter ATP-binding protein EcfA2